MKTIPTQKQLEKLCLKWQKKLRLEDWKIDVQYSENRSRKGELAWCSRSEEYKEAKVFIMPPDILDKDNRGETVESTLIHELLHILLVESETPPLKPSYEFALNSISWALTNEKKK